MSSFLNPKILVIVLLIILGIIALVLIFRARGGGDLKPLPTPKASPSVSERAQPSVDVSSLPFEEQIRVQSEVDKEVAEEQKAIRKKYPWFDKLPIFEKNIYFVYFDLETEKLIGKIYASTTSDSNRQEQLKQQIITRLQGMGINTDIYVVNWQIVK